MRTQSDAHEDAIATAIEAAAHLTPGSIQLTFGYPWTYRVAICRNGDNDRVDWSSECGDYMSGLELAARWLDVAFPEPALATLEADAA